MNRFMKAAFTLATLAAAGLTTQIAQADLHFNNHQTFYAFDPSSSMMLLDVYDTVSADAAGDTRNPATVNVLGDSTSFTWDGSGSLGVTNVATTATMASATLTMPVTNPLGYSHYEYLSTSGQGLFTYANGALALNTLPLDLARKGTDYSINIAIAGQFTPTSFSIPAAVTVTNYFTYDANLNVTTFAANTLAAVPEPGVTATLTGLLFGGLGFVARRRRK